MQELQLAASRVLASLTLIGSLSDPYRILEVHRYLLGVYVHMYIRYIPAKERQAT